VGGEGGISLEQLMAMAQQQQPIVAPMPQGYAQSPRNVAKKLNAQFPKSPMVGGVN
jgi:hypothetical protein